jgi:hypothetical protein
LDPAAMAQPRRHDPPDARDNGRRELTHRRSASGNRGWR